MKSDIARLGPLIKNEAKRRDMKLPHDFFEKAENFIKGIPEEMVEIRFLTYSFLGIEYKNKMVFKCKICGQVLHPQISSDGAVILETLGNALMVVNLKRKAILINHT